MSRRPEAMILIGFLVLATAIMFGPTLVTTVFRVLETIGHILGRFL